MSASSKSRNAWARRHGLIGCERIDGRLFFGGRAVAERKHREWLRRLTFGIGGRR